MAWAVKERNGPVAHGSAEHTWAEGRSGESDTFPFSFAATPSSSDNQRKSVVSGIGSR